MLALIAALVRGWGFPWSGAGFLVVVRIVLLCWRRMVKAPGRDYPAQPRIAALSDESRVIESAVRLSGGRNVLEVGSFLEVRWKILGLLPVRAPLQDNCAGAAVVESTAGIGGGDAPICPLSL